MPYALSAVTPTVLAHKRLYERREREHPTPVKHVRFYKVDTPTIVGSVRPRYTTGQLWPPSRT